MISHKGSVVGQLTDCEIGGNVICKHRGACGIKTWQPIFLDKVAKQGIPGLLINVLHSADGPININEFRVFGP